MSTLKFSLRGEALFPTSRSGLYKITKANWRTGTNPMQVVSGAIGHEKIHFEAPKGNTILQEMATFIQWFNTTHDNDPVLKAGVAHLWFVTIPPMIMETVELPLLSLICNLKGQMAVLSGFTVCLHKFV